MKRAADVPSLELTPRNVGWVLAATAFVIVVSFSLGARMGRGLSVAAGPATPGATGEPRSVEPAAATAGEEDQGQASLGPAANEVLRGIRGVDDTVVEAEGATTGSAEPVREPVGMPEPPTSAPALAASGTASAAPAPPVPAPPPPTTTTQTPTTQAKPPANARQGGFALQVLAGRSKQSADGVAKDLSDAGWPARVERADRGAKGVYYRVRVGRFASREEASRELARFVAAQRKWKDAYVAVADD